MVFTQKTRPRDLSGGLRGLQTASENIRRAFVWSSAKNHTKKPFMWAPRLRSQVKSIRRVSVRSSPIVIPHLRAASMKPKSLQNSVSMLVKPFQKALWACKICLGNVFCGRAIRSKKLNKKPFSGLCAISLQLASSEQFCGPALC